MLLLIAMPGNERLAAAIAQSGHWEIGALEARHFPDGESYLRLESVVSGRSVALICTLAHPDPQILALLFAARLLKENGARSVHLVAPYLAYMRQDRRFHDGEALTSRHFAEMLSNVFDGLVTVDPHLHRYHSLSEIYSIPSVALTASPFLADWARRNVEQPLIIGPDGESEQWASAIANAAEAPYTVFTKTRMGDRDVRVAATELQAWSGRLPVLVDDVISSGETLADAARQIVAQGFPPPVCLAVHGLFSPGADALLAGLGCKVVTTDAVPHRTNAIPLAPLLCEALRAQLGPAAERTT
ncbi:ribose-phosphate diphosphokinase [Sphingobium xenophagum]|uniref:ribose-phosphate diphosphokinase n=1 Tax=Sphingobium xenophagum TaxID=121428 RepID=UPI00263A5B4F|nr:ribose-phosphate diphosphokinase [Sphingobium xenophagum]